MAQEIARVYQQCDPAKPLPADDPRYVPCDDVRGVGDIVARLANAIRLADVSQHLLLAGHRGSGKSTELLRLTKRLSNHLDDSERFFVIYFEADAEDIDVNDVDFPDILLAIIRHVSSAMRDRLGEELRPARLVSIVDGFSRLFKDIKFDSAQIDLKIAKITANIKSSPDSRVKIRATLEPHVANLIQAANDLLDEAVTRLRNRGFRDLVLVVDNLDRIVLRQITGSEFNTHEQLFINRGSQLTDLHCHTIYTIPLSMVFSRNAPALKHAFSSSCYTLPMVKVIEPDGSDHEEGLQAMGEMIYKRLRSADVVNAEAFDSTDTLRYLCCMSGGHTRSLLQLIRFSCERLDDLPITRRVAEQAVQGMGIDLERALAGQDVFPILQQIDRTHELPLGDLGEPLLYNQIVLEYLNGDAWYAVKPIVKLLDKFKRSSPSVPLNEGISPQS